MRGTMLYGPCDIRSEERPDPTIDEPTDAIIRITASCVRGSDLWPCRGIESITQPQPMGHGYVGIVEEVGPEVRNIEPGQFVVGYVGVSHGVELPGAELFFAEVRLHGGPAPVRRFLPELIDLIWSRRIDPGKVFDLTLPLADAAEGYRAMGERRAVTSLLVP